MLAIFRQENFEMALLSKRREVYVHKLVVLLLIWLFLPLGFA